MRADAPGAAGEEGTKFVCFSEVVKELEKNRCQIPLTEDLGIISRPCVWRTHISWQKLSNLGNVSGTAQCYLCTTQAEGWP